MKVLVFAGSNSKNSINKKLVAYSASLLKKVDYKIIDLNDYQMPVYGIDLENDHGMPENAVAFVNLINAYDGFIISLAEHNGSYTAVFKNTMDWASRIEGKFFGGKPLLLLSSSPGGLGGKFVMEAALTRFPRHGAHIINNFSLPNFDKNYSDKEGIKNKSLDIDLKSKVEEFENSFIEK